MAKRKFNNTEPKELDTVYFLKLVIYLVIGSIWLKATKGSNLQLPLPVGLLLGIILASHDHFQLDRKIEFAVLLVASFIGFWLPFGIYASL